jgi:D-arabinitol 4-dehydrogenase
VNVILHLGLGAFHRAHQAAYLQRLHDLGERDWTLVAGNLRPDQLAVEAALIAQGGAYTLETVAPDGRRERERIRSIGRVIPYDPQWRELIAVGAQPATRIISFTVTEGGYGDGAPIYAALEAILRRRTGPVTLLSCDNLRGNGERLRARFGGADATFPNCMVDRITPRPAAAPDVMCERFAHWVIEDRFAAGRPRWERAGVQLVSSVAPYEEAKIRILNASHSALAWAGALRGCTYIHECVADPAVRAGAEAYVTEEVIPCLRPSPLDLEAYRDQVLERFANAALADTVARVAGDSAAKARAFVLPTLEDRLRAGLPIARTAHLAALFHRFLGGRQAVEAFCADASVWGSAAGDARFVRAVKAAAARL